METSYFWKFSKISKENLSFRKTQWKKYFLTIFSPIFLGSGGRCRIFGLLLFPFCGLVGGFRLVWNSGGLGGESPPVSTSGSSPQNVLTVAVGLQFSLSPDPKPTVGPISLPYFASSDPPYRCLDPMPDFRGHCGGGFEFNLPIRALLSDQGIPGGGSFFDGWTFL